MQLTDAPHLSVCLVCPARATHTRAHTLTLIDAGHFSAVCLDVLPATLLAPTAMGKGVCSAVVRRPRGLGGVAFTSDEPSSILGGELHCSALHCLALALVVVCVSELFSFASRCQQAPTLVLCA
jgi:hypothetical protein